MFASGKKGAHGFDVVWGKLALVLTMLHLASRVWTSVTRDFALVFSISNRLGGGGRKSLIAQLALSSVHML